MINESIARINKSEITKEVEKFNRVLKNIVRITSAIRRPVEAQKKIAKLIFDIRIVKNFRLVTICCVKASFFSLLSSL